MTSYEGSSVKIPDEFAFPYAKPYDIQLNFMKSLYKTLELEKIGIFESPTGTGKSLSLICGSLKWLKDYKESQQKKLYEIITEEEEEKKKKSSTTSSAFDWLTDYQNNFDKNQKNLELKEFLDKQVKQEKMYQELKNKAKTLNRERKLKQDRKMFLEKSLNPKNENKDDLDGEREQDSVSKDELDLILDDYQSDDEADVYDDDNDDDKNEITKIYFCSRTHSQLSQFIGELKKTVYNENVRVVTLGSRMNLCINENVLKLGSIQAINDRCLEMQKCKKNTNKSGSKKSKLDTTNKSCDYYKPSEFETLNLRLLEEVVDIEDLPKIGRDAKICPYYGARYSIPSAEVIALPYNILFQKETRQSFSINLRNQIVIIDEAHNLIDTISQIHSVEISEQHVTQANSQLNSYINRYKARFSAKNMLYLRQLTNVLNGLAKLFTAKNDDAKFEMENGKLSLKMSKLWTVSEFLSVTKFFNLNFVKLLKFCDETQLEKKLIGFHEKFNGEPEKHDEKMKEEKSKTPAKKGQQKPVESENTASGNKENANGGEPRMKSPLMIIKQFIKLLSSPFYDGRILLNVDQTSKSSIKYMLLNPDVCFEDIVSQARSVILAGGTMKPISDFEHLIKNKNRIEYFSCGHVIPTDNLICVGLATGPNKIKFDFSYGSRDNAQILDELGKQLLVLSSIVPDGMVVFFVSYDYMDKVMNQFKKTNVISQLNERKAVYYEPKLSSDCDRVFTEYTKSIKKPKPNSKQNGAILFAVVGGKMSEGINFSDELGRCVVVVGQPYPNIKSLELQEKIQYLNRTQPKGPNDKQAGQLYYENLCWKAVNQSIGRAIRHQNDYSCILLIDARYSNQPLSVLKERLPKWIGDSFRQESPTYDHQDIMNSLVKFYENKKKK